MNALLSGIMGVGRWRTIGALALSAGAALTEGISVLLLLPLLGLAGVPVEGSVGRIAEWLAGAFNFIGIRPTIVPVLLVYAGVTILQAALFRLRFILDATVVQRYALALRSRLYSAIARARWIVLSRIRSSDFTFALTTAVDQVDGGANNILFFIATGVVALVYTVLAIAVSPRMSAIVLAAGGVLLLAERGRLLAGRRSGREVTASTRELFANAAEQLGGLKTAKSYGQEERHLELFLATSRAVNRARLDLTRTFANLRFRLTVSSVLALSAILYLTVNVVRLPTAAILLLLFIFSRLVPRLIQLQQTYQEIQSALPALAAIGRLVAECESAPERRHDHPLPVELGSGVRLDDVSFSYDPGGGAAHLTHIHLAIPAGRTTAIVGASGAGKSTLADVLLGLIVPSSGTVRAGETPLDSAHLESWRSQIGYVAQDTFLFNDTVRCNLEWARPGATESEMLEALGQAAATDFVSRLPAGLDTVVGERGVRLSGGERQRLSLARALLRKPRLLILDEATSALDSENEERIYRAISGLRGNMTIVVITHRLSTVHTADLIHVLDEGRAVASGSWDELMAGASPRFRELCRAQGVAP